jgi:hypothetical protein
MAPDGKDALSHQQETLLQYSVNPQKALKLAVYRAFRIIARRMGSAVNA